ncbi:MAG: response regulator [Roseococcus sp.]|nr:response regulator [Roseococcus sp.]
MARVAESRALSILIVDDEVDVAAELADATADEGYTVHIANSAAAALAILAEHAEIGVMVSDIRMPDCDGIELMCRALQGRDDGNALEVILITGHATLDDAVVAVRTGAFDFVRKPFRLQQIFEAMARAVARAIGRRRVAAVMAVQDAQRGAQGPVTPSRGVQGSPDILIGLMHELRTPLVPILGFAEILETQRCSAPDTVEYARLIGTGGRQLLATVDDLVVLAQIERDEVRLSRSLVAAGPFLQDLASNQQAAADIAGKTIHVAPLGELRFAADQHLLRRAVDVLLRIALQRNPRGSAVILSASSGPGGTTILVTHDAAGPGPLPVTASAFAEDVAAQVAPLGIRFARAVAGLHGGAIRLFGEENMPFTAVLTLPPTPA